MGIIISWDCTNKSCRWYTCKEPDHKVCPKCGSEVKIEVTSYPNPTWVSSYTRSDGTHVSGYYRR